MNIKPSKPQLESGSWDKAPSVVVLHATAGASAQSSIDYLDDKGLGYHFIITRDGKDAKWTSLSDGSASIIYQCVPLDRCTFHASTRVPVPGTNGGRVNRHAIGVSLANIQNGEEPYTEAQEVALGQLLDHLKKTVKTLVYLTTHAVIQPWNRSDPLKINGAALAKKHGYTWWKPTAEEIKKYRPK